MFRVLVVLCLFSTSAFGANERLNPNLASEAELAALEGVSPELAAAIVAGRPYLDPEDLDASLSGAMDPAARHAVYASLFRPLNLNTAEETVIELIPDMTPKMVHEFEEYRPYTSMAQFRREMSKYVDEAEVERLASYVFVPVSLNEATREQIMAIPGMTSRMAHEFEEYRPYRSLDEFRREIGKYVSEAEVRRLESYVTLD